MAEDFWQRDDGDDNQKYSGDRYKIVRKNKSLLRRVSGLRTWWLRLCLCRRYVGPWDLQFGHGDRWNCREWNGQRRDGWLRNRLCHTSGGRGRGRARVEERSGFGTGPSPTGGAAAECPRGLPGGG